MNYTNKDVYRSAANEERFNLVVKYLFDKWCDNKITIHPDEVTDEMLIEYFGNSVIGVIYTKTKRNTMDKTDTEGKINIKSNKNNKNKNKNIIITQQNKKTNSNKRKYIKEKEKENKNNFQKNVKLDEKHNNNSIDKILDVWDMECKELQNEFKNRELEKCECLGETFGILTDIENIRLKLQRNFSKDSQNSIFMLNRIEPAGNLDKDLKSDILNVKNKIKLIEANLFNNKIEIDERLNSNLDMPENIWNDNNGCENAFNQQQTESDMMIDHSLATDKMAAVCDSTIFKYIQNLSAMEIQLNNNMHQYQKDIDAVDEQISFFDSTVLNMEWKFFKHFVNNMLVYGLNCSDCVDTRISILETSSINSKTSNNSKENIQSTNIDNSVELISNETAGVVGESTALLFQQVEIKQKLTFAGGLVIIKDSFKNEIIPVLWQRNTISLIEINVQGWYNDNDYG